MKPGRALDALVAEHVMGWTIQGKIGLKTLPNFSTDISAAWEVADKVRHFSRLYDFEIYAYGDDQFTATFTLDKDYSAHSDESAPHAICLAALKAVGYKLAEE